MIPRGVGVQVSCVDDGTLLALDERRPVRAAVACVDVGGRGSGAMLQLSVRAWLLVLDGKAVYRRR